MKTTSTIILKVQLFVIVFLLTGFSNDALADSPDDYLMGQWTFEPGVELTDLKGNFSDLVLYGTASIANGQLDVDNGSTYAIAHAYTGPIIGKKTLVSWLYLEDLNVTHGSALTLDKISVDRFDGIVYGELEYHRWMAGSNNLHRTKNPVPGFEETSTEQLIKMVITYEDNLGQAVIKIYRNDALIGDYSHGPFESWVAGDSEAIFGIRHKFPNGAVTGALNARIEEARIYNTVLTAEQIAELEFNPVPGIPINNWAIFLGLIFIGLFTVIGVRRFTA